jgi:hypothetical protein
MGFVLALLLSALVGAAFREGEGNDDVSSEFAFMDPLNGTEWWYLRVTQRDAEMAWSSPIWLD